MELESTQTSTTAKLPLLKHGDYEMWRLQIKQYFQIQDYALWDVIENGNSFKPVAKTTTNNAVFLLSGILMLWSGGINSNLNTMSIDDLYNNFKIVEQEVKGTTSVNSSSQNIAFVSSPSPNNTNEVPTNFGVSTASPQEMDLKWQLALLSMRAKRFFQKTGKKITFNESDSVGYDKDKVECFNSHNMGKWWQLMELVLTGATWLMMNLLQTWPSWLFWTKRDISIRDSKITVLKSKLEKISKEKDDLDIKIKKFENASQSLDKLIGSQITDNSKRGLGYVGYNAILPPHTGRFSPLIINLSYTGLPEFVEPSVQSYRVKPIEVDWESEVKDEVKSPPEIERKTIKLVWIRLGANTIRGKGWKYISYLTDIKEFDGWYVAFGRGAKGGKITGKGVIRTDHLENFDGKLDEGFFVGYSTNSKAFRAYNTRTRPIEEKLHIKFLDNKPIIAGTNSNYFVGKGASFDVDSDGDNKDNDGPSTKSEIDNQERLNVENNTKDVNTIGPSINTASLNIITASLVVNTVRQSDDFFGADNDMRSLDRVGVDISNISTTYPIPTTPNTRIHKDHTLDNVIGDMQSGMDIKSAFLYERIEEEVYVCQPPGFEDPNYPDKVYKVEKALSGLHQAPRA
nr:ribonuclease H-like domain-containing protein [Tanacetum cinerariifolium]